MALYRPRAVQNVLKEAVCFQCRRSISSLPRSQALNSYSTAAGTATKSRKALLPPTSRISRTQTRAHIAPATSTKQYGFDEVKDFTTSPSADRIIIDVREPGEYSSGHIPTSNNMPIKSAPDGIFLPADEFEEKFGFAKPKQEQEVVFYCRSGVRSSAAAQLAQQAGYGTIGEYRGSWLDWEGKGGEVER